MSLVTYFLQLSFMLWRIAVDIQLESMWWIVLLRCQSAHHNVLGDPIFYCYQL